MIEQNSKQAFNLDTILLAHFVKIPAKSKLVLDIGTGAGALMLYLSQKTRAKIIGVEIQEERFLQASSNIVLNHLEKQCSAVLSNIKTYENKNFDCIVSNPPFFKVNEKSNLNEDLEDTIARHEVELNLDELAKHASRLLKFGGKFFMIHRPDRFAEIIDVFHQYQLEIKRIRFVHPYIDEQANHVLIEAMKNGNPGVVLEPPLILYYEKHILTKELVEIYGGNTHVTKSIK
jgi:tRNA1(Val) A37 N6-methylase TrmN6